MLWTAVFHCPKFDVRSGSDRKNESQPHTDIMRRELHGYETSSGSKFCIKIEIDEIILPLRKEFVKKYSTLKSNLELNG